VYFLAMELSATPALLRHSLEGIRGVGDYTSPSASALTTQRDVTDKRPVEN